MRRTANNPISSPYYPPRARWHSRLLLPWFRLQRALHLENVHLPGGISLPQFVLSLIVPGFSFYALGKQIYGWTILGGYCLATLIFLVALGRFPAGVAFGLMISAHAISVYFLELRWFEHSHVPARIIQGLLTTVAVAFLIYVPLVGFVETHWFLPLQVNDGVLVISPRGNPDLLRQKEWAAFRISPHSEGRVWVDEGYVVGPVLAIGGESAESINVPENHWLMRANFDRHYGHGEYGGAMVQQSLVVSRDQFVGRPFKRWFFRKQTSETP